MRSRLRRHYDTQSNLDIGVFATTVGLPRAIWGYARRQRIEGHQLEGYGRFDLPLLASYSRSGTNWVRYAIEWVSGRPTPGQVRLHPGDDFVVDRAHNAAPVMSRHPSVVLVLRDYRECLLRHLPDEWEGSASVEDFLDGRGDYQQPSWFVENLRAFDAFAGPKLLVYYEDLMASPAGAVRSIAGFLGLPPGRTEEFVSDVDARFRESVESYTSKGHQSASAGSRDTRHHSAARLTPTQRTEFDEYYRTRFPELFERYLTRYAS